MITDGIAIADILEAYPDLEIEDMQESLGYVYKCEGLSLNPAYNIACSVVISSRSH